MVETEKEKLHFRHFKLLWALLQVRVARSGAEFGDDGMDPDKDGTCLYCPNLSFCQEITRAYALVQQHQPRW